MPKARAAGRVRRGWRTPDALWAEIAPLLPPRKAHPLGCHNPRVDDRRAMDAIFFRLRTGCQWNALSATGLCSSSSAHRRFQEWRAAGVFHELWRRGLTAYNGSVTLRSMEPCEPTAGGLRPATSPSGAERRAIPRRRRKLPDSALT